MITGSLDPGSDDKPEVHFDPEWGEYNTGYHLGYQHGIRHHKRLYREKDVALLKRFRSYARGYNDGYFSVRKYHKPSFLSYKRRRISVPSA